MERVLILMSRTGGGHEAVAKALQAAFLSRCGTGLTVDVIDIWMEDAPFPLNQLPKSYSFLAERTTWFYQWLWDVTMHQQVMDAIMAVVGRWAGSAAHRVLDKYKPDLIIAVHPLLQQVPLKVLAQRRSTIPFATVVAELCSFHPSWWQKEATLCFVPSAQGYAEAQSAGLRDEQIRQCGMPIGLAFASPARPQAELRRELGMEPDLPAALIAGGAEGMGSVAATSRAIASRLAAAGLTARPAAQMLIICGRNQKLYDRLSAQSWPIPTRVKGFVTNMADCMAACDCIVTKAGPNTICEAMSRGLPMVLNSFIPGQEAKNVAYVVENGIGVYQPQPDEIARVVARWLGPERPALAAMAEKARQLARPQAGLEIVDELLRSLVGR